MNQPTERRSTIFNIYTRDPIPRLYDLYIDDHDLVIELSAKNFASFQDNITDAAPIIEIHQQDKSLRLPPFSNPTEKSWGFGKCLHTIGEGNQQIQIRCPFPSSHEMGRAVSASLGELFRFLYYKEIKKNYSPDQITPERTLQLALVRYMETSIKSHGGSLSVDITPRLIEWIQKQPDGSHQEEIQGIMKRVWLNYQDDGQIHFPFYDTSEKLRFKEFRAWFRQPKWVNFSCPGNACGLDPSSYHDKESADGYQMSPHNVDDSIQQFMLLASVAKMCEIARDEGH